MKPLWWKFAALLNKRFEEDMMKAYWEVMVTKEGNDEPTAMHVPVSPKVATPRAAKRKAKENPEVIKTHRVRLRL